jgi:hypothetical protein
MSVQSRVVWSATLICFLFVSGCGSYHEVGIVDTGAGVELIRDPGGDVVKPGTRIFVTTLEDKTVVGQFVTIDHERLVVARGGLDDFTGESADAVMSELEIPVSDVATIAGRLSLRWGLPGMKPPGTPWRPGRSRRFATTSA